VTAARELAQLASESSRANDEEGDFIGTVIAATSSTVTVRPDSAFDGALIGPIQLAGTVAPAVNDRVLCLRLSTDLVVCVGKFV
jgi:hypothetical protein